MGYKKEFDLQWTDLFMEKSEEIGRGTMKCRRFYKRIASKVSRNVAKRELITEMLYV